MSENKNTALDKLAALRSGFAEKLTLRISSLLANYEHLSTPSAPSTGYTWRRFQSDAHKLAGAAGTFGFSGTSEIAAQIDKLVSQSIQQTGDLSDEASHELQRIIHRLRAESKRQNRNSVPLTESRRLTELTHRPSNASQSKAVILVDDDVEFAISLENQLAIFSFTLIVLDHPRWLEETLAQHPASVVIMDVIFPDCELDGIEVIQRLKQKGIAIPPVIFISSTGGMETRIRAVRAGGIGYFLKPVKILDIVDHLNRSTQRESEPHYRVLIVDDDTEVATFYSTLLENAGFEICYVPSPLAVKDSIKTFDPEVLLMDIDMPECTGFELAQAIRQDMTQLYAPIVFLTGANLENDWLRAMEAGGDEFLRKTIDPRELVATVLSRARRSRALRQTLHRQAENEALYSALADAANEGFITTDDHLRIVYWNHGAEALYGYTAMEVLGKPLTIILPDEEKKCSLNKQKPPMEGSSTLGSAKPPKPRASIKTGG